MGIKVMSWNAQGGSAEKLVEALNEYCKNNIAPDIIFLQEQGTCDSKNATGFVDGQVVQIQEAGTDTGYTCLIAGADPTAKVQRCTLACLIKFDRRNGFSKKNIEGPFLIENYHGVSRPMVGVLYDGILMASIHAVANGTASVAEVKAAIKKVIENSGDMMRDEVDENCWILIGDMNSKPEDYNKNIKVSSNKLTEINLGTESRENLCNILCSGKPTQGASGSRESELDFSFLGLGLKQVKGNLYENVLPKDSNGEVLSDHNMIACTIEIK